VIKARLLEYLSGDGVTHSLDMATVAKRDFLSAFRRLILKPRGLDYKVMFPGPTGTNAVEAAIKLARKVTGRSNVVAFTNAFHGMTLGALALTGNASKRAAAGVELPNATRMPFHGYLGADVDTIDALERYLEDSSSGVELPAAFILETVQAEGGVNVASLAWLRRLEKLARKFKVLLIVDDIQVGCGRTGPFFSFEAAQLNPDIVCLSKSLSGYGLPLAITLCKPELDVWEPGEHNGTFRGNNHAFVTATAALEHYWRTPDFAREVQAKGEHLGARLQAIMQRFLPHVVEVRGRGLMRGIRCADPKRAAAVTAKAFGYGLIIERSGPNSEVIKFLMPLTITLAEMDEGLDILERALVAEFGEISTHEMDQAMSVAAE
jgi:diaminobutyrate-2-oxoglutarate transaminase